MSDSHKPSRPDENERIRRLNGWITEEKYDLRLNYSIELFLTIFSGSCTWAAFIEWTTTTPLL